MTEQPGSKPEADKPSPEIGPEEVSQLEAAIRSKIVQPQDSGEAVGRGSSHVWYTDYVQSERWVQLTMPEPGYKDPDNPRLSGEMMANLNTIVHRDGRGHTFVLEEEFIINLSTRHPSYRAETVEHDPEGHRVRTPQEQTEIDAINQAQLGPIIERANLEASFGGYVLTDDRFQKIMAILDSLRPEEIPN
jgi:hypothetical protein